MLDQQTKRKLDSTRQILVGKVPDPKAQVEQITTALIYKFMDDMDKENEEVGLKTQFFIDDWKKFSWTKILDNKLSGQERLDLYVQAITNMSKNPHIPQLFRDIFKGAFLPYNDPRTLSLFLKEINEFNYEHSENLGNAFEYLLSILGSQGDAGQFRTPRHIIDFIVEVVDPKKNETILDPACGTAGFLISAYKHIRSCHSREGGNPELTPDEKLKLMNNLAGYDISPDMVKLALVNMYLHGFPEPKIHEYDTLSSEKRWDETFDVIMANPPFMTPKGGIVPHKRFSIQANRAEVLFVDYIVEHLTIKGRAGIIVPEGIIFQSNNAYTQLRKKLIEDGLFAVVSLPAGVFNPYAGVKTSILLFDNEISKRTKNFLFIKIQNDGFDLGAQRREHNKNDLPKALEIIKKWKSSFVIPAKAGIQCLSVSKEKIAETGDYNLSGDRYKEVANFTNQKWEMMELGGVCVLEYGKPLKEENRKDGEYPVFGSNGIVGYHDNYLVKGPFIIVGRKGTAGAVVYSEKSGFPIDTTFYVRLLYKEKIILKYLYFILRTLGLDKINTQAGVPGLNRNDAYKIRIPLPPIEVQNEIVEQINFLEEERRFLHKEDIAITKRQTQVLESAISSQKREIMDSKIEGNFVSNFRQVEDLIVRVLEEAKYQHFIIENLILHLRELSYFFEKFFYDELEHGERKLLVDINQARNAICHRSSYFNNFNDHLIIQGGLNYHNDDIEIQYGRVKISLRKIIELYKKFREVVAQDDRTNWMKQNPAWEMDQRRFDNLLSTYKIKVKAIQEKIIQETKSRTNI